MSKEKTKERILKATLKLISQKGYLGATMREISMESGVTELTLYRHFGSKETLFEEMLQNYTFLPRLKILLQEIEKLPYEEALRTVGVQFLHTLKERDQLVRIMLSEINIYPEKIRRVYNNFLDELIQTLAGYFSNLKNENTFRNLIPKTAARAFLGMIFAYFQAEEIVGGRNITQEEMEDTVREYVDIFVHGTTKISLTSL